MGKLGYTFTEVRCTFEDEGIWYVDAWQTDDADEEGIVVAKINEKTYEVTYTFDEFKENGMILEVVREKLLEILNNN